MFLTSAHQWSSSGSALLRGWQPVTGSGTSLAQVAEICANSAVLILLRKMRYRDGIHLFPACFHFSLFFLFKKIKKEFVKDHYRDC